MSTDEQYQDLVRRHQDLDTRLHHLIEQPYPSSNEQIEEITLKKQKLAIKDQLQALAGTTIEHARAS